MNETDAQYEKMIETPIPRLITSLAVPTVLSMLVSSAYNIADTFFVAKTGAQGSAAIGVVFSVMALIQAIGFAVGMGAGSTISRLLGKQKEEEAAVIADSAVFLSLLLGGTLLLVGITWIEPWMRLLGASETVLPYAVDYGRYIFLAAPVMTCALVLASLLRAQGQAKYAMFGIVSGSLLNVFLDPMLIFWAGLGIKGAAIATAISQTVGLLILIVCVVRKKCQLTFSIKGISRKPAPYRQIAKQGFPSFLRQGLATIATVFLNRQARGFGDEAVAAMAIVGKIFMVFFCFVIGFGQGYQPVIGYNYGAKQWKRVRHSFVFTLVTETFLMLVLAVGGFLFAEQAMVLFMAKEREVVEIGTFALRCQCVALIFVPLDVISNMTFQSIGENGKSAFLSACRQGIFFLPLIWVLPGIWGIMGIQTSQAFADILAAVACVPFDIGFFRKIKEKAGA